MDLREYFQLCMKTGMQYGLVKIAEIDEKTRNMTEPERTEARNAMTNEMMDTIRTSLDNVVTEYQKGIANTLNKHREQ